MRLLPEHFSEQTEMTKDDDVLICGVFEAQWNDGMVQRIRPHILHLLRGQAFEIDEASFFTMGGAGSHDITDGILNPAAPDFEEPYRAMRSVGAQLRANRALAVHEMASSIELLANHLYRILIFLCSFLVRGILNTKGQPLPIQIPQK